MSTPETLADYDGRIHFLINRTSRQFEDTVTAAGQLEIEFDERLNRIWTHEKGSVTSERIAEVLQPGDILIGGAGDGSDQVAVRTLYDLSGELQRTPFVSWYGGNANMGPGELVPKKQSPTILDVISSGVIMDVHPLVASISPDNDSLWPEEEPYPEISEQIVLYFGGIGLTGTSVSLLEEGREDKWGIVQESKAVRQARKATPELAFDYSITEGDETRTKVDQRGYEFSVINGDRMAKFGRFPSSLDERKYFDLLIRDIRWSRLLPQLAKLPFKMLPGELVDGQAITNIKYSTLVEKDRPFAQLDGDLVLLAPRGTATFTQHETPYRAVTTRYTQE